MCYLSCFVAVLTFIIVQINSSDVKGSAMVKHQAQLFEKKDTLVMLLKEELEELQPAVVEMKEEALVKQSAKRKVLYNLTRQGQLELVYSLMALAQFYLGKELFSSCIRTLHQARNIKVIGDAGYLLGSALVKKGQKEEAIHFLETCLQEEWIEPSKQHQRAAQLQAMTILQQLYFETGKRQKLLELSYRKIQQAQDSNSGQNENHFHALSLLDMANIHQALGEHQEAVTKLQGAITIFQTSVDDPLKLLEAYTQLGNILTASGKSQQANTSYTKARQMLQKHPGCLEPQKEAQVLEAYIQSYILF